MSAIEALEAEIRRVVTEDADLQAEFGSPVRLVDGGTARSAFPFIRFVRHDTRPEEPFEGGPIEHRVSLEVLVRSGGRAEATRLLGLLADRLRASTLTPAGLNLVLFHPVYSDVFLRADGTIFRGLLRLRALSEVLP